MSKIERGQFSSLLRRYLGMTGTSDVTDELSPEISAALVLEQERPEWEFLKGAKLMSAVGSIVPSPGLASNVKLRNPATSGVVGIVQPILISPGAVSSVDVRTNPTTGADLATTFRSNARDTRYPGSAFPGNSAIICSGDYGIVGAQLASFNLLATTTFEYNVPIVLTPGFDLHVICVSVNVGILVTFNWLEKKLEDVEKQ